MGGVDGVGFVFVDFVLEGGEDEVDVAVAGFVVDNLVLDCEDAC